MANIFVQPCDEGVIRSTPSAAPCAARSEPWILAATILGSSMVFIDGTVVNVALPAFEKNLGASLLELQWVVESYSLFLAALLLVGGAMGDRFGRRRMFCLGVALFALASIGCGLARTIGQLIVARVVQGVGGALLVPGSLAIISASFDESRRGQAIGTWSGFTAITSGLGPILGGWLIDRASWRLVFFINAPLALIVLAISLWHVPESRNEETKPNLDRVGSALATLGLGPSVYGLIESSRLGFGAPIVFGAFLLGAMLLTLFVCVEARSSNPLLPLTLFRSANFTGANLLTLFLYMALAGAMFFFPLNLIQVQDYSATEAGAAWVPFILIVFLLSRWSGGLVKRYGAKIPLTVGPAIAAVGYGLFMIPGAGGSYWTTFFPTMVVLGLGMALSVAPLTTTVMSAVPKQQAGISSGINNAVSRIAGLLGIAVLGIVMVHTFKRELKQRLPAIALPAEARQSIETQDIRLAGMELPPNLEERTRAEFKRALDESFVQGFGRIMLAALILALAAAITALMLIKD